MQYFSYTSKTKSKVVITLHFAVVQELLLSILLSVLYTFIALFMSTIVIILFHCS